jgi:hypothetical protein
MPMVRPVYSVITFASIGVALALPCTANATTVALSGNCSWDTGTDCTSQCVPGTVNCSADSTTMCGAEMCSDAGVTESCTSGCETQCQSNPGAFRCTDYCSAQCDSTCSAHNNCGAASSTDCATDCQAQCTHTCTQAPPTTVCATACATSCTAIDNLECTVSCQVTNSTNCTTTPQVCTQDCNATTGGVIICNGQVVDAETSFANATAWYVSHLDATFSASATATGTVTTGTTNNVKCSASPSSGRTGAGFLFGGLSVVSISLLRRRNRRS